MGSAGSSKGCGGHQATRTRAAGDGRGGLGSAPGALRSDVACGALRGTPSHLEQRKYRVSVLDGLEDICYYKQVRYACSIYLSSSQTEYRNLKVP